MRRAAGLTTRGIIAELSFDIDTRRSMETKKQVVSLLLSRDLLNPVNTLTTDALFDAYKSRKGIK